MKERPILFSSPMVRAILEGRKSQTRRIVKPQVIDAIEFCGGSGTDEPITSADVCLSYGPLMGERADGSPGKATNQWRLCSAEYPEEGSIGLGQLYGAPGDLLWVRETFQLVGGGDPGIPIYRANWREDAESRGLENIPAGEPRWQPSIFMPRWASRLTLRITGVRVERLQEISEYDCEQEGIGHAMPRTAKEMYAELWNQINGKGSWDANPWVWCLTFERIA